MCCDDARTEEIEVFLSDLSVIDFPLLGGIIITRMYLCMYDYTFLSAHIRKNTVYFVFCWIVYLVRYTTESLIIMIVSYSYNAFLQLFLQIYINFFSNSIKYPYFPIGRYIGSLITVYTLLCLKIFSCINCKNYRIKDIIRF